ncbi:hypothetical protein PLICRDRAFT_57740 [Plicaturopsis crispa FD-325 SS-3]|uniref:Unplaced genomic scaffold PLICRscaffold_18, whole genome shotgun sequence n=1 Tax=Plicaturopsis crispa FD-325 SS-3 TaxID=944288 RepID=A0A0C9SR44_PLICR|nr:hypothetical protein PLICRDRAFT_57740 [Plicaturopsis crispa FD-325 SS-3]
MGGDHKCPVCQATFTRPQHVARHMRSHTGDRPYKCQHCGDQFARSDLLSRHVNKCHANEKPPAVPTTNRRKGSASASRATTSKQACDQCVQSSLPCDGCNPCAKCVQRKCRCTYVKFHRQTAPTGPGHHPRPSSAAARLPMGMPHSHTDDFILGPPPMSMHGSMPVSAADLYAHPFSFTQMLPQDPGAPDAELARYRIQADALRRASMTAAGSAAGESALYGSANDAPPWLGNWAHDSPPDAHDAGFPGGTSNVDPASYLSSYPPGFPVPDGDGSYAGINFTRPRRQSQDFSSGGSTASSSASNSSVHLPLPDVPLPEQQQMYHHVGFEDAPQPPLEPQLIDFIEQDRYVQQQQGTEGRFSSAFGLMSLDDPAVLAGLATDGAPFFSNAALNMPPGDPNSTPMPAALQQQQQQRSRLPNGVPMPPLPTPGANRETELRELRDFWKTYMRTPLSGPGPSALEQQGQTLAPGRRPRVASLPSAKTPTADGGEYPVMNGATSSVRTTLHGNADDLRSYEAAVLARKAPTNLNLVPRKGRGANSASPQAPPLQMSASASAGQTQPQRQFDFSRPSSSASTSELAHVFGATTEGTTNGRHVVFSEPEQHQTSRESSAEGEGSSNIRPSFKRLPSQTLGPANAKRALLSTNGQDDEDGSGEDALPNNIVSGIAISKSLNGRMNPPPPPAHPNRQVVSLTDRHRRASGSGAPGMVQ